MTPTSSPRHHLFSSLVAALIGSMVRQMRLVHLKTIPANVDGIIIVRGRDVVGPKDRKRASGLN
uniref:Uncharacterized protein n=1 Tax=Oryza nivara TaxID=4536 RepID=A0A0E0GUT9_ORYNI